ncbi:MAG: hypothetical protein AAF291_04675 [Pseudomonadota bacterium]
MALQLELSEPYETAFIELEKAWVGSRSGRIDLWYGFRDPEYGELNCAVELKFPKRANHREPNNRYDVFADLARLEEFTEKYDLGYLFVVTDHPHYHSAKRYSEATASFDFRDGSSYNAGSQLVYNTAKPHGEPIVLQGDYQFSWSAVRNGLRFLSTEVHAADNR